MRGGAAVRIIWNVFFFFKAVPCPWSLRHVFSCQVGRFRCHSLSRSLSLMTSHLSAWKRELDLSEKQRPTVPVCSGVLGCPHLVATGGCGLRQGRLGLVFIYSAIYTWLL